MTAFLIGVGVGLLVMVGLQARFSRHLTQWEERLIEREIALEEQDLFL